MKTVEQKKEVALNLSRAIMGGAWDEVDNLLAEDFRYIGDGAPAINKQQYIEFMRDTLCTAMSDMDMNFMRVMVDGDLVAVDYTNNMTHSGEFFGILPTQKRVQASGQFMREIKNDKVSAEWQTTNAMGLIKQLTGVHNK